MTDQLTVQAPVETVEAYLQAMQDKDWDTMSALLDDDVVYHNVGTPVIHGRHRVLKFLRRGFSNPRMGFGFKNHRIAGDGTSVLTERTDVLKFAKFEMHFWVCGVFEVHDGRITLWRDYFDFWDFSRSAVRGVAALAIPPLRREL